MRSFYSELSWHNRLFFPLFMETSGIGNNHVQLIEVMETTNNNNNDIIRS